MSSLPDLVSRVSEAFTSMDCGDHEGEYSALLKSTLQEINSDFRFVRCILLPLAPIMLLFSPPLFAISQYFIENHDTKKTPHLY